MRMLALSCLATLVVVTSLAEPVEAGRRRRRARRTVAAAGVVAVATRRPRAVAPVVVAAPAVVQRPIVVLTPDLTITEIVLEDDLHCITVKNIGQTASPETQLRLDFHRAIDGAVLASKEARVLPLQVNQTVRFRLRMLPRDTRQIVAKVDPGQTVVELSEQNNQLVLEIAEQLPDVEPAPLDDVDVWVQPQQLNAESAGEDTSH